MNGLAMARYGPRLSQDGPTAHTDLLEAYLAIFGPILDQKSTKNRQKETTVDKIVQKRPGLPHFPPKMHFGSILGPRPPALVRHR